jgi:hypothetical protein
MSENVVRAFPQDDAAKAPASPAPTGPSTEEGLRLFRAFVSIQDPTLRRTIINMIEVLGRDSRR